jgi:hypothetical protein
MGKYSRLEFSSGSCSNHPIWRSSYRFDEDTQCPVIDNGYIYSVSLKTFSTISCTFHKERRSVVLFFLTIRSVVLLHCAATIGLGLVYFQNFLQNRNSSTFVCIWQILFNYGLKDSSRQFRPNCAISFYFHLYLILHVYV